MNCISISDFEKTAKEKLDKTAYDYYSSGANEEITLKENTEAFKRIFLKYRVLVDVSKRDLSAEVLGTKISMPVIIAPTAFHKLAYSEGETATARAAGKAGTIMILSTLSNCAVEEVVKASSGEIWFQLYVFKDREITRDLVRRAESAGCKAIVLTVDAPFLGLRERDVRNKFNLPEGISVKNLEPVSKEKLPVKYDSGIAGYFSSNLDPSLTWKDAEWLKSITSLPLLVKGISCKEDAQLSVKHGADGIVVSNHGGRQLDTCRASIDALPEISEAVSGQTEILMDSGVRRGTDIFKAIALGAKAVLTGRPVIWGLAADGENGVSSVLEIFRNEFDLAMALCGCDSVKKISRDFIV